jgi:purine-binding chemotaxis protein CheW
MGCNQLVVFSLDKEEYGVEIAYVQEIIRIPQITKIPDIPVFVEGIINLRGKVIPVIDLKKKFRLGQSGRFEDSRLVVLDIDGTAAAIIVDDVSEVMYLDETSVETLSAEIIGGNGNCLKGIGKMGDRLLLLLDIKRSLKEAFVSLSKI